MTYCQYRFYFCFAFQTNLIQKRVFIVSIFFYVVIILAFILVFFFKLHLNFLQASVKIFVLDFYCCLLKTLSFVIAIHVLFHIILLYLLQASTCVVFAFVLIFQVY